ncbi:MAG: carboxylate-amine ligase [Pseudomonadota bacterium]
MTAKDEPSFSIGMEEEYLLIDPVSRDLVAEPPASLLSECQDQLGGKAGPEFFRSQIEIDTPVSHSMAELRDNLIRSRQAVTSIANRHDLTIIAASTHPFAQWMPQKTTQRDRYQKLADDLGQPLRRLLICATHVHVGIEDPDLRIDLMNQARYFLPHLLALSTSSPFWQGRDTQLKSYRLAVFSEMPRTGIPEPLTSFSEFERHLAVLAKTKVMDEGSKIWWDIRPSVRFPTLEMRICDICTRLEDGLTIAAMYVCILRRLWRLRRMNAQWRRYTTFLLNENRWRAMRYGVEEGLIDFGRGEMVAYPDLLNELIDLVYEDAEALGCVEEIENARDIIKRGTSADQQLKIFRDARESGHDEQEALKAVVDWLANETQIGL